MDLNRAVPQLSLLLLVLLSLLKEGLGIHCYMCNSNMHKKCTEVKTLSDAEKLKYQVDCSKLSGNNNYTLCRKIDQSVEGDHSIVRQCATKGDLDKDCRSRVGTKKIKMKYCHCASDHCNTASRQGTSGVISLLLAAVPLFMYMLHI